MTIIETLHTFMRSGGDARASTLHAMHPSRFYTYTDTTPPPAPELDYVSAGVLASAWSWDPTAGLNQHPDHCGKCSPNPFTGKKYDSPLDYRRRIGHARERDAKLWASVYTSGTGLLYSRGRLIAARQSIGGRDGDVVVMVRSTSGLDAVQRRHVALLRAEFREARAVARLRGSHWASSAHLITVGDQVLVDHACGPRWAGVIFRQDGDTEPVTVHAWNRDGAWDALRVHCVALMSDGVLRSPQSVNFRPTSASVDALAPFVPIEVTQ